MCGGGGSVHRRLLGGQAFRLAEQSLGGWTAAVLVRRGDGGRGRAHLGLARGGSGARGDTGRKKRGGGKST